MDILVSATAIEGVNYNEGFMADDDGWVPQVLLRNSDGGWTVKQ